MRDWTAARIADAAGATLVRAPARPGGPRGAAIDSRELVGGELFIGLEGSRADGGGFVEDALSRGAWGALVGPEHAERALAAGGEGALLAASDPLAALAALARAWRRELDARVVAVTGSTGKTSTKAMIAALLAPALTTVASERNRNTEIGLPLAILAAPAGTQALVLELAMRAAGQIAELTAICEPDVGVIVNVGPAHLERLGSIVAIAAAKAELIDGLRPGTVAVIPAHEPLLEAHVRDDVRTVRFGDGGDVAVVDAGAAGVVVALDGEPLTVEPGFRARHLLEDLCAAIAAAHALGIRAGGPLDVAFPPLHGERVELADGVTVINDCYNANPMSMRAALDDLAATAHQRRVAVLGEMLELGDRDEERYHRELGEDATAAGVSLLVTVGPRAAWIADTFDGGEHVHAEDAGMATALLRARLHPGDTVLVKGSRAVGLEAVAPGLAVG